MHVLQSYKRKVPFGTERNLHAQLPGYGLDTINHRSLRLIKKVQASKFLLHGGHGDSLFNGYSHDYHGLVMPVSGIHLV